VLDLGCGTGAQALSLARLGFRVVALDRHVNELQARPLSQISGRVLQAEATQLPLASGSFAAVVALDLAEHVDDHLMFTEAHRILQARGRLVASVPALPGLWSYRDRAAGHVRRYTHRLLRTTLESTGFHAVRIFPYLFFLLPLVTLSRRFGRESARLRDLEDRPPAAAHRVLAAITQAEVALGRWIRWPLGSTLIAIGEKA
jgi:SAM-dependent methyltransferase